ncbi:hypothetical protein ACWC5I_27105 [Kitasatospora sp. NPDC001574]
MLGESVTAGVRRGAQRVLPRPVPDELLADGADEVGAHQGDDLRPAGDVVVRRGRDGRTETVDLAGGALLPWRGDGHAHRHRHRRALLGGAVVRLPGFHSTDLGRDPPRPAGARPRRADQGRGVRDSAVVAAATDDPAGVFSTAMTDDVGGRATEAQRVLIVTSRPAARLACHLHLARGEPAPGVDRPDGPPDRRRPRTEEAGPTGRRCTPGSAAQGVAA